MNAKKIIFKELLKNDRFIVGEAEGYLTMPDVVRFILEYEAIGVVQYSNNALALTEFGLIYLLKNRNKIFLARDNKDWQSLPTWYKASVEDAEKVVKRILKEGRRTSH